MANESILDAIGDIARDKGIARERLIEVVQEAVTAAAKRKFKNFTDVEARLNISNGQIEVFRYKTVTEELGDPENEISLDAARALDEAAEPGDEVEYEIDNKEVTRVISQTARQLIFQKIREAERETIFEKFKDRVGEVLNGVVSRTERGRTFMTFNQTEAILYGREQIPHERYAPGDHVRVILLDVLNDPKEPSQLVISRAHPLLLTKLFEMEVPEVYDGIVEIVTAAREPGRRAKIAVSSNDPDVDPVGACVGMRGSRVQAIISELRGEKIDIIKWVEDLPGYIANALAPAELTRIKINDEAKEIDVEVEPDQLSLAIGRQGQNVRLASKLSGYKINVSSTSDKSLSLEEQIRERLLASQAELANADFASRQAEPSIESDAGAGDAAAGAEERAAAADGDAEEHSAAATDEASAFAPAPSAEALAEAAEADAAPPVEALAEAAEADATPPVVEQLDAAESEAAPPVVEQLDAAESEAAPPVEAPLDAAAPEPEQTADEASADMPPAQEASVMPVEPPASESAAPPPQAPDPAPADADMAAPQDAPEAAPFDHTISSAPEQPPPAEASAEPTPEQGGSNTGAGADESAAADEGATGSGEKSNAE